MKCGCLGECGGSHGKKRKQRGASEKLNAKDDPGRHPEEQNIWHIKLNRIIHAGYTM